MFGCSSLSVTKASRIPPQASHDKNADDNNQTITKAGEISMSAAKPRFNSVSFTQSILDAFSHKDLVNAETILVEQRLSQSDFEKQRHKCVSKNCRGGAIGIVVTPDDKIVLVNRTKLYSGWALPGGLVEQNESFAEAFKREIAEEIGVVIHEPKLMLIEEKEFISSKNEKFNFLLAVYIAKIKETILPHQTTDAVEEGLTAALFFPYDLPEKMILKDKNKIESYLAHWR
jgi:ADP-ribose pyrophosphatase YjhB (NUDIX family)